MPTGTSVPIATVPPQTAESIEWTTYVFMGGVSIEHPSDWTVDLYNENCVYFRPPSGDEHSIRLEVYDRPLEYRAIADPHSWEGNEGGYEVHWEKPISIEDAEGLEFVWGAILDNQWDTVPSLQAIYYSERHEMDIRLSTVFDVPYLELTQWSSPADAISARFGIFEHMVRSVRINRR